jgi:hypothetical protein
MRRTGVAGCALAAAAGQRPSGRVFGREDLEGQTNETNLTKADEGRPTSRTRNVHRHQTWFRHWSGRFTYTEGIKYLAEAAQAFWLIDVIASWAPHPTLRREEFVVWKLTVRTDHTATITADDGDGRALITQDIPFTDFPLDKITLYLTDHVLLLTSEY